LKGTFGFRPIVKNNPPSRPSVRIHAICVSQLSSPQLSAARANKSSGVSSKTALGYVRRYSTPCSANQRCTSAMV
jgi:hypothetical protein